MSLPGIKNIWRHHRILLAAIILLGIILRVLYLFELNHNPAAMVPIQDAEYHHYWANALATGNWDLPKGFPDPEIQTTPYFRPPGYPYFLALVFMISSSNIYTAILVQMLLGLLNILLVYRIAKRWAGIYTALIASLLMACHWAFILFEAVLLDTILHTTFLLLTILALTSLPRRFSYARVFLAGILLGLTCIIRANTLLFIPVAVCWLMAVAAYQPRHKKNLFLTAIIFITGNGLAIAPVTLRNQIAANDTVLISSNAGLMFNMGNSAKADGLTRVESISCANGAYGSCFDYASFATKYAAAKNLSPKHSNVSRHLIADTLRDIRANPSHTATLLRKKFLLYLSPIESGHNNLIYFSRNRSQLLHLLPTDFALLFSLCLTALLFPAFRIRTPSTKTQPPDKATTVLLVCFLLTYFSSLIPFVFSSQYRIVLLPIIIMFAARAIHLMIYAMYERNVQSIWVLFITVALLFFLLSHNWTHAHYDKTAWHMHRAYAYERLGNSNEAIKHYQAVLQMKPGHSKAEERLTRLQNP